MSPASESTSRFATQTYVFDPRPAYPLQLVVKRYFVPGSSRVDDPDAPTLVFAHGTGFHKELWEPVIDDLAALVDAQDSAEGKGKVRGKGKARVAIGDIWAVDCPNHGDSAALNAEVLKYGYEYTFGWEEFARSLHLFINGHGRLVQTSGFGQPGALHRYAFPGRNVIGIGHSMGSVALALSLTYAPSPTHSFAPHPSHPVKSLILVEPMIMLPAFALGEAARLITGAEKRRDTWASPAAAREAVGRSLGRQGWEGRCVRLYVEHGLKPVEGDGSTVKDKEDGPVTLKCTKVQEAACYRDPLGPIRLYASFGALVASLPVHVLYGAVDDYLPAAVKTDVVENQAGGVRNLASFARVPGGGHLVPFQAPTALAEKIFDALLVQAQAGKDVGKGVGAGRGEEKVGARL